MKFENVKHLVLNDLKWRKISLTLSSIAAILTSTLVAALSNNPDFTEGVGVFLIFGFIPTVFSSLSNSFNIIAGYANHPSLTGFFPGNICRLSRVIENPS